MKFFSWSGRRGELLSPTPGDRHPQMRLAHIDFWKSKIKKFHIDPLVTETFPGYVEAFLDLFAAPRNKTPLKEQTKKKEYYKASSRSPNPNFRMFGIFKVLKICFRALRGSWRFWGLPAINLPSVDNDCFIGKRFSK